MMTLPVKPPANEDEAPFPLALVTPQPVGSPASRDAAKTFLWVFVKELRREISLGTKIIVLVLVLGVFSGLAYVGRMIYRSNKMAQQNEQTINGHTQRIDGQDVRLNALAKATDSHRDQLLQLFRSNESLLRLGATAEDRAANAAKVWTSYRHGVCLIAGTYVLIDPSTELPLRHPEDEADETERLLTTGTSEQLTPYGNGPIFVTQFVGTGFHVGNGLMLTNRHVVLSPWISDGQAQLLISVTGATPRVQNLTAYFPGRNSAIGLTFVAASKTEDVAVTKLSKTPSDLPAWPINGASDLQVGDAVSVIGFPGGPDRILALLPPDEAVTIQRTYGGSLTELLDELMKQKLIEPLLSQGYVTDLARGRLVFDATISDGASGSPLFNGKGQVVGISFAEVIAERASNFAVPIKGAIPLLLKAGWRPNAESKAMRLGVV